MMRRSRFFLLLLLSFFAVSQAWATTKSLVIARIYGSGGTTATGPKYDYVELFNGGPTAVNLKYFTLQYQGGTSTSGFGSSSLVQLPSFVLQPGQYYLIQFVPQTAPTQGTDLTLTPDWVYNWTNTTDYSSSNGKLALVFGSQLLPACAVSGVTTAPPPSSPNLVDFFSFGNGTNGSTIVSNCAEGSAPGPNGSSTRAQYRTDVCADTDNNGADITTDNGSTSNYAPVQPKHNSATTPTPCYSGTTALPSNTAANVPLTALDGVPLTITAQAAKGANPTSNSLRAIADLTAFSGSATQTLYDDGTNGDALAGDSKFTYTFTVPASQPSGTVTVPVSVIDDFYRFNTKNLSIGVGGALPTATPIHSIQSAVPSAYNGQQVTIEGIVTAVTSTGFYVQAPDAEADADPSTSEAIFVASGILPSGVAKGVQLYVTGTVSNNGFVNTLGGALTTLEVATGVTLPTAVTISSADQDTTASPASLRRFEGMRVNAATLTTASGTGGAVGSDGSVTSDGNFYAVFGGVARPFREPGALYTDTLPTGSPSTVTRFDGNLERLLVNSLSIYGTAINVTAQATVTGAAGILEFASGTPTLELAAYPTGISNQLGYPANLAAGGDTKFTVASLNFDDLYNATKDGSEPVVLSAANYAARLAKASTQIRVELNSPDVVAVQNVENLVTLQDIVSQISSDAATANAADPGYVAYLQTGSDSSGLNTGFLVRPLRATVSGITQAAQGAQYLNPATSAQAATFTHPPLVLSLAVKQSGGATYPLTIINTLLTPYFGSSLPNTAGASVRAQREAQAEQVAQLVQTHQAAGEGVVVVGGFNSLQVADGYVDVVGAIKGLPADASTVVVASPTNIVATPLVDLGAQVAQASRYSHIQDGNAEAVDTILVSSSLASGSSAAYLHGAADYQEIERTKATSPLRDGSHDPVLAYLAIPKLASALAVTVSPASLSFGSVPAASTTTQTVSISNTGASSVSISSIAATGTGFSQTNTCGSSLAPGKACTVTITFSPIAAASYTGNLTITDNAPDSPQTVALTGTGITTSATATPTSLTFPSTIAGSTSATQTVTVTNTGSAALTLSAANFSTFPGTVANNCSAIAAGSTCTVVVAYAPAVAGSNTGTLTLSGNIATPLVISLSGTAVAAVPQAVLTPATIDFGSQTVNIASSSITVTLSNPGTGTLTGISTSITGDFARTTTCGATLAVNASCTITITFTPTTTGARTGLLSVADNATGSPQTVSLAGTGIAPAPIVTLTPAALTFSNTLVNSTSATQTVTVKNTGYAALTFTAITATNNFTVAGGTCSTSSSIAVNGSCTVIVAFAPKSGGTLTGSVTLADNAAGGSQSIALTGNGVDFTLAATSGNTAATVAAGQTATYSITITPQNFTGTVTLTCAGNLPSYSNCTAPSTVALTAGTPATISLSVNTFSQTLARSEPAGNGSGISLAAGIAGLLLAGLARKRDRLVRLIALTLFAVGLSAGLSGCSVTQKSTTAKNPYATAPGTYSFSLTATSGTITHTLPLTLTVQ